MTCIRLLCMCIHSCMDASIFQACYYCSGVCLNVCNSISLYRTILLSVISLLNEPNTFSAANVDASVLYRRWRDSRGKDKQYIEQIKYVQPSFFFNSFSIMPPLPLSLTHTPGPPVHTHTHSTTLTLASTQKTSGEF